MKTLILTITATLLLSGSLLNAQTETVPKFEVGLNYSGVHVNSANYDYQRNGNGGSGSVEYNLNHVIGLVGDVGGYANTRTGIDQKMMTYLFGPRFNLRHSRLNPYAQFVFGGGYLWYGAGQKQNQNGFATAAGGGLDYNFNHLISFKPIQVEYLMTQLDSKQGFGSHQNSVRYSAGVVFKFGEK